MTLGGEKGSGPEALHRSPGRVDEQIGAEVPALVVGADREPAEQDDRYGLGHIATDAGGSAPLRLLNSAPRSPSQATEG